VTGEEIQNNTNSDYLLFKRPTVFAPVSWLSIGPAIVKALNGDASDFATQVGEPPTDPAYGERAIECLEFPVQARNFAELMGRTRICAHHRALPGWRERDGAAHLQVPRLAPPAAQPAPLPQRRGSPAHPIVNATHDPSTSYVWALSMQAQIPRSVLLTRDRDGHTSYFSSPLCAGGDRPLPDPARPATPRLRLPRLRVG
jgi:TAP-like protein